MKPAASLLFLLAPFAACSHPVKEGPTLGENPNLLGPNVTAEIEAGAFYLGPGDLVQLDVYEHDDLSRRYTVDTDGSLYCHLVGKVQAQGLTREQLRQRLTEAYAKYLVDPSLDLTVELSLNRKLTVLGHVAKPGVFPLSNPRTSVLEAIALAGGIHESGDTSGVVLAREVEGNVQVRAYNLDLLFDPRVMSARTRIPYVQPGDYLYVLRTDADKFEEYVSIIDKAMRSIVLGERAILLAPQVGEQLTN